MFNINNLCGIKAIKFKPINDLELVGFVTRDVSLGRKNKKGTKIKCREYEVEVVWAYIDCESLIRKYTGIEVQNFVKDLNGYKVKGSIRILSDKELNKYDTVYIPLGSMFYPMPKGLYCYKTFKTKGLWEYIPNDKILYQQDALKQLNTEQIYMLNQQKLKYNDVIGDLHTLSATLLKSVLSQYTERPVWQYDVYTVDILPVKKLAPQYIKLPAYAQIYNKLIKEYRGKDDLVHAKTLATVLGLPDDFVNESNTGLFVCESLWQINILLNYPASDAWLRQLLLFYNNMSEREYHKYLFVKRLEKLKVVRLLSCDIGLVSELVVQGIVTKFIYKGAVWVGYKEFTM